MCVEDVPGLRRKALTSDGIRSLVPEYIEQTYGACLLIYTNGSHRTKSRAATAAFTIPSLNITWQKNFLDKGSSTTVEVAAITAALGAVPSVPSGMLLFFVILERRFEDLSTRQALIPEYIWPENARRSSRHADNVLFCNRF